MLGVRLYMLISMCCCSAIDGFNSTLFAYGQTGSGKTFTITGGAERYQDRGIIPRSLSYMFQEFKQVCDSAAWAVFGVSDFILVAASISLCHGSEIATDASVQKYANVVVRN